MSDFDSIYRGVIAIMRDGLSAAEAEQPVLEDPAVAPFCFVDIPRSALLAAPDDRTFVESVYFKIRDEPVSADHRDEVLARLAAGATRDDIIDGLLADPRTQARPVRVVVS